MAAAGWRRWLIGGLAFVLAAGWIAGVTVGIEYGARHSWLFWLEHWTGDWRTMLLSDRPKSQHRKVAVVTVNEDTVDLFPYRTPIDRRFIARLVTTIDKAGAEAIALDFLFLKATEPDKEDELARAIKAAKSRVVVAVGDSRVELSDKQRAYQQAFLEQSGARGGYANLLTGGDRIVRFVAPSADSAFPQSLAVAAAKPDAAPADGPRRISWLLRPADGVQRFFQVPAHLLAAPDGQPAPAAAATLSRLLAGKIVFIGADLIGLDRHMTPLASWENDDEMAGVMIHAQVAAQLLDDRKVTRVKADILRIVYALLGTIGLWIGLRYGGVGYSLYFGTTTLILAAVDISLFIGIRQFLPFGACLAALVAGLIGGIALRQFLATMLAVSHPKSRSAVGA